MKRSASRYWRHLAENRGNIIGVMVRLQVTWRLEQSGITFTVSLYVCFSRNAHTHTYAHIRTYARTYSN